MDKFGPELNEEEITLDPSITERLPFQEIHSRYFDGRPGEYVLKSKYGDGVEIARSRIKVVDYGSYEHAILPKNFDRKYRRGVIKHKEFTPNERQFMIENFGVNDSIINSYVAFEVEDIYSLYKYVLGPRATTFNHRFGNFNDYDHSYTWVLDNTKLNNAGILNNLVNIDDGDLLKLYSWSPEFGYNLVRHTSSNHFPSDDIDKSQLLIDFDDSESFDPPLDELFMDDSMNQAKTAQRWLPWVAYSPRSNSKLNRWVKTVTNLDDFFNGYGDGKSGAWSGLDPHPNGIKYDTIPPFNPTQDETYYNTREVILGPEWFFGDKKSQTDVSKDGKRLIGHIRAGRIIIIHDIGEPAKTKSELIEKYKGLKVYNNNSTKGQTILDWSGQKNVVNNLPDHIFIAQGIDPDNLDFPNEGRITSVEHGDSYVQDYYDNLQAFTKRDGYPLLTFDMATRGRTEMASKYNIEVINNKEGSYNTSLYQNVEIAPNLNSYFTLNVHNLKKNPLNTGVKKVSFEISTFGNVSSKPNETASNDFNRDEAVFKDFRRISFNVKSNNPNRVVNIHVEGLNEKGNKIRGAEADIAIHPEWRRYQLSVDSLLPKTFENAIKTIHLSLIADNSLPGGVGYFSGKGTISDIELTTGVDLSLSFDDFYIEPDVSPTIPVDDEEFMTWVKKSALRYVTTHSRQIGIGNGDTGSFIQEATNEPTKISISGLGMSIAGYILAAEEDIQLISADLAKLRVRQTLILLKKIVENTDSKFHGFPFHYYKANLDPFYPKTEDNEVSTIDWAICAFGVRLAAAKYGDSDLGIKLLAHDILYTNGPDWSKVIHESGRISFGIKNDGNLMNSQWGLSFSEETDLVHVEAIASQKLTEDQISEILNNYKRDFSTESKMYPSWFGAGFTYNWLQLWTGELEIYKENSIAAFCHDSETSREEFDFNAMGLTAGTLASKVFKDGFIEWTAYFSNLGSDAYGTEDISQVKQLGIMPYGAALAYPFLPEKSVEALREYVKLGLYSPLRGFPESISIKQFPEEFNNKWFTNWEHYDINQLSMAMAIDMKQRSTIPVLMNQDSLFKQAVDKVFSDFHSYHVAKNKDVVFHDCITVTSGGATSYSVGASDSGLGANTTNRILISPNPIENDLLHLNVKEGLVNETVQYTILDTAFKRLFDGSFDVSDYNIEVQSLPSGTYYAVFKSNTINETHLFIKD